MSSKNPDIAARLRTHPAVVRRHSAAIVWAGIAGAVVLIALWVWLLMNAVQLSADFASYQDSAVTLNQRVGSHFGVLIGVVSLPIFAALSFYLGWVFSYRYFVRTTGSPLTRCYRGYFPGTEAQGADFQNLLRTRDPAVIGTMNSSSEKGNLIVEAWHSPADHVGIAGTYAYSHRQDPGWELVEFSGPAYAAFEQIFLPGQVSQTAAAPAAVTLTGATQSSIASATPATATHHSARFAVTATRRAKARVARRGIVIGSSIVIALATLAWIAFPPGEATRTTLAWAITALAIISALLIVRIALMAKKADRLIGPAGTVLEISPEGIVVAGDLHIPLSAVSGVWAVDRRPELRVRADKSVTGAPGRVMLAAGANTADIAIGVLDAAAAHDSSGRLTRFRQLPSGATPARVEIPFGSQFDTQELHEALRTFRAALPATVPVRLATGAMDYAAAWAGTADAPETIAQREADLQA